MSKDQQVDLTLGSGEWLELGDKYAEGIAAAIYDSVSKCDHEIRADLFQNIVLAGGGSQFKGLAARLTCDLREYITFVPKISASSSQYSSWQGGSILGSLSTFPSMFITRVEYEEYGSDIVFRKCF